MPLDHDSRVLYYKRRVHQHSGEQKNGFNGKAKEFTSTGTPAEITLILV
jgi:hypothetical protein